MPRGRVSHTATPIDEDRLCIIAGGAIVRRTSRPDDDFDGFLPPNDDEGDDLALEDGAPSRSTHLMWRMFCDVHVLDRRTMEWACVLPNNYPAAGSMPHRRGHSAALHEPTRRVVVYGGVGASGSSGLDATPPHMELLAYRSDVWVLHTHPAYSWEQPAIVGVPPAPRRGHRAVILSDGQTMVVVGGYPSRDDESEPAPAMPASHPGGVPPRLSGGSFIGVYTLHLESWRWANVLIGGQPPFALALFGCSCVTDRLYIFGGHEDAHNHGRQCVNTLWTADLTELCCIERGGRSCGGPASGSGSGGAAAAAAAAEVAAVAAAAAAADSREVTPQKLTPAVVTWKVIASSFRDPALDRATRAPPMPLGHLSMAEGQPPPPSRFCNELVAAPVVSNPIGAANHLVSLFVFGGTGEEATLDDMYRLDVTAASDVTAAPLNMASTQMEVGWRYSTTMLAGHPVRQGGEADEERAARREAQRGQDWANGRGAPSPRNGMSLVRMGSSLLLFGGGVYGEIYHHDTWEYQTVLKGAAEYQTVLKGAASTAPLVRPPAANTLALHLADLVCSERFADVSIRVRGGHSVAAHKLLLCSGASEYFLLALEGASGFLEATQAASGERVVLTMPETIDHLALLLVLRWMYTAAPPSEPLDEALCERAGGAFAEGGAEAGDDHDALVTARVVSVLVAADALGIDGLRVECEQWFAACVDDTTVIEIMMMAEGLNCNQLISYCLNHMRDHFGARHRRCVNGPRLGREGIDAVAMVSTMGADAALAPEAFDALAITKLPGFDLLSATRRDEIAWHAGLPAKALVGTAAEIQQQADVVAAAAAQKLASGKRILIRGMVKRTDLNGRSGVLVDFDADKGRWGCRVQDVNLADEVYTHVETVHIRPANCVMPTMVAWWAAEGTGSNLAELATVSGHTG